MRFLKHVLPLLPAFALLVACESTGPEPSLPTKGVSIVVDSAAYHLQRRGSFGFQANVAVTVINDSDHEVFISQSCGNYALRRVDGSSLEFGAYACALSGGAPIPTPIRVDAKTRYTKVFDLHGSIQPQARPQITLEDNVGEVKFRYVFTDESGSQSVSLESESFRILPPDPDARVVLDLRDQFIFTGVADNKRRIYALSVSGGDAIRVTPDSLNADCPVISHDGRRILFIGNGDVWVMTADGSEMGRVSAHPAGTFFYRCPSWSPDDKKFVWTSMTPMVKAASPGAVYVGDIETGIATVLTTGYNFSSTDWSPDGAHILVGSNKYTDGGPYDFVFDVLRLDGTKVSQVESGRWGGSWAPDGKSFTYLCGRKFPGSMCIADITGSTVSVVTDSVAAEPSWSPGGDRIAFIGALGRVYIVSVDGKARSLLNETAAFDIAWSRDSRKIAWACRGSATDYDICRIGADGTGFTRLPTTVSVEQVTWPPLM